jgi:predicted amidohydrolase
MNAQWKDGPRPVVLGTATLAPFDLVVPGGNPERLANGLALIDEMARRAAAGHERLDMVLLPEHFSASGNQLELAEPVDGRTVCAVAEKARRYGTNAAVPLWLREGDEVYNAVVLLNRSGEPVGSYRKVFPVVFPDGSLENGIAPGRDFPVFDMDFGRVGVMICFDEYFEQGWTALARKGAELVLFPSASSAVALVKAYAWRNHYYVLASSYRPPTVLVDPLGTEIARTHTDRQVLVTKIDLDYRIVPWNALMDFGELLGARYGSRIRQDWHYEEDLCLLTSRDPSLPVQEVMDAEGLFTLQAFLERNAREQDGQRPGPPVVD